MIFGKIFKSPEAGQKKKEKTKKLFFNRIWNPCKVLYRD